uniref:Uncharacterized protein LOC111136025 n=1 Tax=Crassostrea virginica TaxID=6565 RepID=A0A8B8EQT0_CRAVI|nr:uncharacterized protein LOC111136025 [Crassostrea virginica]XP_022342301.1 uncharacterized protein LOC111136025 [Crassostrea virginica]
MTCIRGCIVFSLLMSVTGMQRTDNGNLRCGQTDVYIKPECVCSFHRVYEAVYHEYSFCPPGSATDLVTKLKCPVCKKYSLNNNGPCINGGRLTCKGEEVAPEITCQCPQNYEGKFCEHKIENVTRICDRILKSSIHGLPDCALTGQDCITFSRNKMYAYKCNETHVSQDREGLPLCIDTEDLTTRPSMSTTSVQGATRASHLISGASSVHYVFFLKWYWIYYLNLQFIGS